MSHAYITQHEWCLAAWKDKDAIFLRVAKPGNRRAETQVTLGAYEQSPNCCGDFDCISNGTDDRLADNSTTTVVTGSNRWQSSAKFIETLSLAPEVIGRFVSLCTWTGYGWDSSKWCFEVLLQYYLLLDHDGIAT
ncbi:hypothetical protein RRF57_002458 [Xylaria bambusicola]|uniref:Uncharacterized protein n=1 Tax=Xylaria bambusicola TaxID=326684 RepID=A0AAN7UDP2_9PEZI